MAKVKERFFANFSRGEPGTPVVRVFWDDAADEWKWQTNYVFDSKDEFGEPISLYVHSYGAEAEDATDKDIAKALSEYRAFEGSYYFRKLSGKQATSFVDALRAEKARNEHDEQVFERRPIDPADGKRPVGHGIHQTREDAERAGLWARAVGRWPIVIKQGDDRWLSMQYDSKPDFQPDGEIFPVHWDVTAPDAMEKWNEYAGGVFSAEEIARARAAEAGNPGPEAGRVVDMTGRRRIAVGRDRLGRLVYDVVDVGAYDREREGQREAVSAHRRRQLVRREGGPSFAPLRRRRRP